MHYRIKPRTGLSLGTSAAGFRRAYQTVTNCLHDLSDLSRFLPRYLRQLRNVYGVHTPLGDRMGDR